MAVAFKTRIFDLILEFLTHTFVFGNVFQLAGAVSVVVLQALLNTFDDGVIGIKCDFHDDTLPFFMLSVMIHE